MLVSRVTCPGVNSQSRGHDVTIVSFDSFPQLLPIANDFGDRKNQVQLKFSKGEHWKEARSHARVCRSLVSISATNER